MTQRTGDSHLDIKVWGVTRYSGKRKVTYRVRWLVGGKAFGESFASRKLAESFRAGLLVAVRNGEAFHGRTGLPPSMQGPRSSLSWITHAMAFVDMKWPHASPRHRKSIAEGLTTATVALLQPEPQDSVQLRTVLMGWTFNTTARRGPEQPPDKWAETLTWIDRESPSVAEAAEPAILRTVLDSLALTNSARPASSSTVARKRSAVYSLFQYAVELNELTVNPIDKISWTKPIHTDVVDRRVVVNPEQARALLSAVASTYPSLEAFFGCIYYAAMRPSEVRHLSVSNLDMPPRSKTDSWGTLHLEGSTQTAGSAWTDSGRATEDRSLKHRARRSTRDVPASPELIQMLTRHMEHFPPGVGGRLFVTRTGRAGTPLPPPYASPQSMGIVYRIWGVARRTVFTDAEFSSPLAKRPYDLRHAAVSLWLNAGVPPTQVAEWAGHSVNVLLRVYAKCIVGQDEIARQRVQAALQPAKAQPQDDD